MIIGVLILLTREVSKLRRLKYIITLMTILLVSGSIVINALPERGDIDNIAPIVDLSVMPKKKPVDIVILTDYTDSKLSVLNSQINALKANFNSVNVDPVFHIISDVKKIGTQADQLYMFRRYGRFSYKVASYKRYQNYGLVESYAPHTIKLTELWEQTQGLYSQRFNMPVRNPQNVSFTKSNLISYKSSNGSVKSNYYNVTIRCTNDVKNSSAILQEEIWYRSSNSTAERVYGSILAETATVDKNWIMQEKISDVTFNIYSLDFDRLNTLPLRTGSDRHMIFLSDAIAKDYSRSFGNYFSFGALTDTVNTFIKNNNFTLYGVLPNKARFASFGTDKVTNITPLGETALFHMENGEVWKLGDLVEASDKWGQNFYPEIISDIGKVKKTVRAYSGPNIFTYMLMDNGTVKYFNYVTDTFVTINGAYNITGIYNNKNSSEIYLLDSSGNAFLINNSNNIATNLGNPVGINRIIFTEDTKPLFLTSSGSIYSRCFKSLSSGGYTYSFRKVEVKYSDGRKQLPVIKDVALFAARAVGSYGLNPALVLYPNGIIQQFSGIVGEWTIDSYGNSHEILCFVENTSYSINESNVKSIESNDVCVFIYKNDGTVKMLNTNWQDVSIREDDGRINFQQPLLVNTTRSVPLTNIQKTVTTNYHRYFFIDSNNRTYMYDASKTAPLPVMGTTLIDMGTNVNKVLDYPERLRVYILYNDGTVREMTYSNAIGYPTYQYPLYRNVMLPITDVKDIYVSASNTYLLTKDGYVLANGTTRWGQLGTVNQNTYLPFANPFKSNMTYDRTKNYYSIFDVFKNVTASEFYPTGEYTAAFNSIYKNYENYSGAGSIYVLLGNEIEYESEYDDYEDDPEHSRKWSISHNPGYFDNSMGLSQYHNPTGFTTNPPAKLDKVGKYVINLKARDNPKSDDRFDNYRLWSLGDQNLTVYVHRKPIALQRITVEDNGNGTYTVRTFDAGSYDLDHNVSRADKGIAAREWRWKESSDMNWHYEQISKADCRLDRIYTLQLRVQDVEGAWSDYNTIEIANNPPVALFTIDKPVISTTERLGVKDRSFPQSFSPITHWNWIVKKLNTDGSVPTTNIQDDTYTNSNKGTDSMDGFDVNVKTDYADTGAGTYRIYLRVMSSNGMWSDGGTNNSANLGSCFTKDIVVEESLRVSNFRVVKVRDLHLDSYYHNSVTGQYEDKPINVNGMAVDYQNFGSMVDGLTKGYLFEYELDTINFNEDTDTIEITPHFYTCDDFLRDTQESDLYWENSYHEILKAGEGGHASWAVVTLDIDDRTITGANTATWRGSYLIPGTAWAVQLGTSPANAKASRINRDILVNFEIKGYKDGIMRYDYNLQQWPLERTVEKQPYKVGDVIRYSHIKCNLDDNEVILNRP